LSASDSPDQRMEQLQQRLDSREASARKYKDAVRAIKHKLAEKQATIAEQQAQLAHAHAGESHALGWHALSMCPAGVGLLYASTLLPLPTPAAELSSVQRMLASGPPGSSHPSPQRGGRKHSSGSRSPARQRHAASRQGRESIAFEDVADLERARIEVASLQRQLQDLQVRWLRVSCTLLTDTHC